MLRRGVDTPEMIEACLQCKRDKCVIEDGIACNRLRAIQERDARNRAEQRKRAREEGGIEAEWRGVFHTANGETHNIKTWARKLGVSEATLRGWLKKRGGNMEAVLAHHRKREAGELRGWTTSHCEQRLTAEGVTRATSEWCAALGVSRSYFSRRLCAFGRDAEATVAWFRARNAGTLNTPLGRRETLVTALGETLSASEWARRLGVSRQYLSVRARQYGEGYEGAIKYFMARNAGLLPRPPHSGGRQPARLTAEGETLTAAQWAGRLGTTSSTVLRNLKQCGGDAEAAIARIRARKGDWA